MLYNNLLVQVGFVALSTIVFIVVLEAYGYILAHIVRFLHKPLDGKAIATPGFIVRLFLGGLAYTLFFLLIGSLGWLTKSSIIWLSCAAPLVAFIIGRRWRKVGLNSIKTVYKENASAFWGALIFLAISFVFWFRPATGFDAMWYHLTVPKLFLDNHTTAYQGVLVRYALQPTISFFWSLWPLSLTTSTAVASIAINAFQALMLFFSLIFASNIGNKVWGWTKPILFVVPLLLGTSYLAMTQLGSGGNDIVGLAYALVTALYCFYQLQGEAMPWTKFTYGLLLIVGLATIKIFFSILAVLILIYWVFEGWRLITSRSRKTLNILAILAISFIVTYLPWLIRSYLGTRRLLDPVNAPGLNQQVYVDEGGGSATNHWTIFIYNQFYSSIIPILTFIYSPLVALGIGGIFYKKLRLKSKELWLTALISLWAIFFASIAIQWRYYLPSAEILMFLGIPVLILLLNEFRLFGKVIIWSVLLGFTLITFVRAYATSPDSYNDPTVNKVLYVRHFSGINNYMKIKVADTIYDYYEQNTPAGLTPNEPIFVANADYRQPLTYGIHNLAYINNPIIEPSVNESIFSNINSPKSLASTLKSHGVSYVLSRTPISSLCNNLKLDVKNCSFEFKQVLNDKSWNVRWYKLS